MADPQRDLAPIIEPLAPLVPGAAAAPPVGIVAAIVALLLVLALAWAWHWRRQAPLRALRRLPGATNPVAAADELAALLRRAGVTPTAAWQADCDRLRFGPPLGDATATLARLCLDAETLMREKR